MSIKTGVKIQGISPEMVLAYALAREAYRKYNCIDFCVITSCKEGVHKRASLHYKGLALDLRLPPQVTAPSVTAELKHALGAEYDVVLESDHIHVEYDPKEPEAPSVA